MYINCKVSRRAFLLLNYHFAKEPDGNPDNCSDNLTRHCGELFRMLFALMEDNRQRDNPPLTSLQRMIQLKKLTGFILWIIIALKCIYLSYCFFALLYNLSIKRIS